MASSPLPMAERISASPQPPQREGGQTWSPFHSSLKLSTRVPGTPVRQTEPPPLLAPPTLVAAEHEKNNGPPTATSVVQEFKENFTTLDFLIEYKLLCLNCPRGIYIIPSAKSLHEWHGVIFVRSGPFQSGVFRFTIYIPDGYPHLQPMVRFHSRIFHPYVHASNGALNLLRGLPPWEPNTHHIWNVVQCIADCFYKDETWLDSDLQQFKDEAKTCVKESIDKLYDKSIDEDGNLIRFKELDEETFQKALATLMNGDLPQPPETKTSMFSALGEQVRHFWDRTMGRR